MLLPKVRYSIAYRFTGCLSKGMTAHTVTDDSHKPIAFRHINDPEGILVVMPSTSLAYCYIFYLHISVKEGKISIDAIAFQSQKANLSYEVSCINTLSPNTISSGFFIRMMGQQAKAQSPTLTFDRNLIYKSLSL